MNDLKRVVDRYMNRVPEVKNYCDRCLKTERWNGNVILMIVDAAFTSIGLNYFKTVVPKVNEFDKVFLKTGKIKSLEDLASANTDDLMKVWKNRRSWEAAKSIASRLISLKREKNLETDAHALIEWANNAELENWKEDLIGRIKGVGINTFQYLRMMGGVDTVMPDKIVKRVIERILKESNTQMPIQNDLAFIKTVHEIAEKTGYRAIELCWMTWLIQSEAGIKYSEILSKI